MTDALLDRADDRATIAISVHETTARIALGTALLFTVFVCQHAYDAWVGGVREAVVASIDVVCTAWAAIAAYWLRKRAPAVVDIARSELIGFVLTGLITFDASLSAYMFDDARELFYLAFLPLGMSAVDIRRWPWRIVTAGVCAIAIGVAWKIGDRDGRPGTLLWALLTMTASVVIASAIYLARRKSFESIVALQHDQKTRNAELAVALTSLEAELAERRRVEAERAKLADRERELADQLRHMQKLDAIGTLAGGIAHDINNVLAAILGVAELAMEDAAPGSAERQEFTEIMTAAERGAQLTRNLLGFARRGKHRHEPVVVGTVLDEVLALLARTAPRRIAFTRVDAPEVAGVAVMGDASQLGQVVMNLCLNAIEAIPEHGTITIRQSLGELADGERAMLPAGRYLMLEVVDTGTGMTAETLEHAFEPFYSTKTSTTQRSGSGLGLAMVYGTVRDHLGEVSLRSALGAGTTALLYLPVVGTEMTPVEGIKRSALARLPDITTARPVLVIDDEESVRRVCTRMLQIHDVKTSEADSGAFGLGRFRAEPTAYSMVLLDLAMPGMTGAECFRALRAIDPAIPIVLMSGFPKDQSIEELLAMKRAAFLAKPFTRSALIEALAAAARTSATAAA